MVAPTLAPALAAASLAFTLGACGDPEAAAVAACPAWPPSTCAPAVVTGLTATERNVEAQHIADDVTLTHAAVPPTLGNHRGMWAEWGEYKYLPPERWLHNLEHGGAAVLYHPDAPKATIEGLRQFVQTRPADKGGKFRYVLTPFPGLKTTVAVVTWGWKFEAACFDGNGIEAFLKLHYRKAPEDFGFPGDFKDLWLGYIATSALAPAPGTCSAAADATSAGAGDAK